MKQRFALVVVVSLIVAACASMQGSSSQDLVNRAVQQMGGADKLGSVKSLWVKATVKQWEPEQSAMAGGEARFANNATFEAVTDVATRATRIDWVRKFEYPTPRTFTFTEIVTPDAGYVAGIDSNGRTKQSMESTPPAHSMSGLRLAATHRELRRASSGLFLEMLRNPGAVSSAGSVTAGGVAYPTVSYRAGEETFWVMFDSASGLPARIRTLDYDSVWGDVTYDLVLSDWQTFDGIKVAATRTYELNGKTIMEVKLTEAKLNVPVAADRVTIPAAYKAAAAKPVAGKVPHQWVIRRQFIGTYLDSDVPSYDTRGSQGLQFVEVAPGVQHVRGGTHHSLLVEQKDHLIVFDSPVSDWQSNWVLATAKAKYPNKPVKYLVLTHHHMDHTGGLRAYVAQGATLVVGKGAGEHFRKVLAAPFTRNPDLAAKDLSKVEIIEVADKRVFGDGASEVHAYLIENPHANATLIGYVPAAKLGYVTDIWSPGAPLPDKLNPALASLVAGVKKAGIQPAKFAGGHGSVDDYSKLTALEGK